MDKCNWKTFDELVQFIQSVKILSYDTSVWQNTKCTCKNYLKNNFCKHATALSYRLEALNFESIAMEEPITARIKRGRPKANAPALQRQPNELQPSTELGIENSDELPVDVPTTAPKATTKSTTQPKKRAKKAMTNEDQEEFQQEHVETRQSKRLRVN